MKISGQTVKGIIFDVDGTLLDTVEIWVTASSPLCAFPGAGSGAGTGRVSVFHVDGRGGGLSVLALCPGKGASQDYRGSKSDVGAVLSGRSAAAERGGRTFKMAAAAGDAGCGCDGHRRTAGGRGFWTAGDPAVFPGGFYLQPGGGREEKNHGSISGRRPVSARSRGRRWWLRTPCLPYRRQRPPVS